MSDATPPADTNPFAKYKRPDAANPFAKYAAPKDTTPPSATSQTEQPSGSFLERLWTGIVGTEKKPTMAGAAGQAAGHGLMNPIYGGAQIGARLMESPGGGVPEQAGYVPEQTQPTPPGGTAPDPNRLTRQIDRLAQQRERAYQQSPGVKQHPYASMAGELAGEIASPTNLMAGGALARAAGPGAGLLRNMAAGAAGGAIGGVTQPVTAPKEEDYWSQKGKQILGGATMGAGAGAIGSAVGGTIAPNLSGDAATLASKGVQLAPGQMIGGGAGRVARGAEAKLQSFPILGDFVSGARTRSLTSFNEATINQALEPIGATLPKGVQFGRNAIKAGDDAVSNAFDTVLGKIPKVNADRDLINAVKAVQLDARQRPAVWKNLQGELSQITRYLKKGDSSGRELQNMASELGRRARGLNRSENFFEREVGKHLEDVRSALYDAVERQFPKEAVDLQNARSASAMMMRVGNASARRATSDGIFTPSDLLQAVKSGASGVRKREFQHGDALFQDWAQAGQRLLPSMVPDSGTAGRLLLAELIGMGIDPMKTIMATGGALGAGLGYRGLGAAARSQPGAVQQAVAEATRKAAPTMAPGFGGYPWLPSPKE